MFNESAHPNSKVTREIIGCAMRVHSGLGNGFQEAVYQRALSIELHLCGIEHRREVEMPIFYKGYDVGTRRVDFLIGEISVELKAIIQLENVHLAQAKNYLEAYNLETGLLINFGAASLDFKRLINPKVVKSLPSYVGQTPDTTIANSPSQYADHLALSKKQSPKS